MDLTVEKNVSADATDIKYVCSKPHNVLYSVIGSAIGSVGIRMVNESTATAPHAGTTLRYNCF